MSQKSLRQLAKEIGVPASYLSQVLSGKKKASVKVAQALVTVNQSVNQEVSKTANLVAKKLVPPAEFESALTA